MSVFQKVRGWIGELFSIGIDGPQVVWDSTNDQAAGIGNRAKMLLGDKTDPTTEVAGDMARMAGADPTEPQDFVTQAYGSVTYAPIAASAAGAVKTIEVVYQTIGSGGADANAGATKDSTAVVPTGARVVNVKVDVIVPFDGTTPTITVGGVTTPNLYQDTLDNKATKVGVYEAPQYVDGPNEVGRVVVSSATGTVGHARVLIQYTTPEA